MGERTLRNLDSDLRGCRVELRGAKCLRLATGGEIERGGVDDEGELSSSHSGGAEGKATVPDDGAIHAWFETGGNPSTGSNSAPGVGIGLAFDEGPLLVVMIDSGARILNI